MSRGPRVREPDCREDGQLEGRTVERTRVRESDCREDGQLEGQTVERTGG